MSGDTKMTLSLDKGHMEILRRLREASGPDATFAAVFRDALGYYEWTRKQVADEGYDIVLMKHNAPTQVILLPFHEGDTANGERSGLMARRNDEP